MTNTTEAVELKPCPLCNTATTLVENHGPGVFRASCEFGCGLLGPLRTSKDAAIAMWNDRAATQLPESYVKAGAGERPNLKPALDAANEAYGALRDYALRLERELSQIRYSQAADLEDGEACPGALKVWEQAGHAYARWMGDPDGNEDFAAANNAAGLVIQAYAKASVAALSTPPAEPVACSDIEAHYWEATKHLDGEPVRERSEVMRQLRACGHGGDLYQRAYLCMHEMEVDLHSYRVTMDRIAAAPQPATPSPVEARVDLGEPMAGSIHEPASWSERHADLREAIAKRLYSFSPWLRETDDPSTAQVIEWEDGLEMMREGFRAHAAELIALLPDTAGLVEIAERLIDQSDEPDWTICDPANGESYAARMNYWRDKAIYASRALAGLAKGKA